MHNTNDEVMAVLAARNARCERIYSVIEQALGYGKTHEVVVEAIDLVYDRLLGLTMDIVPARSPNKQSLATARSIADLIWSVVEGAERAEALFTVATIMDSPTYGTVKQLGPDGCRAARKINSAAGGSA